MWDEVVQVRLQVSATERTVASGYAVGPRLVVTSAHVLEDATGLSADAELSVLNAHCLRSAKLTWRGDIATLDAALLELDEALPEVGRPPSWGKLTSRSTAVEATAMGFPRVLVDEAGNRVPEQALGTIAPGVDLGRRYDLKLHPPYPEALQSMTSPWAGFSGAAAIANGLLVGIVATAVPGFHSGRLSCVPAWRLLADPGFRQALLRHGIPATWEPVELNGVLVRKGAAPWSPKSPASLLRADAEVVRFRGRHGELERLLEWCATDSERGVSLITGPGGQGKTRLANRFAEILHARNGWATGFIPPGITQDEISRIRHVSTSTLLVVDYAETRVDDIAAILATTARSSGRTRVLLLARSEGEWWRRLRPKVAATIQDPVLRIMLGSLEDTVQGREAAYHEAIQDLAQAISHPPDAEAESFTSLTRHAPNLASETYDSALSIQLRALLALLADDPGGEQTSEELESRLLDHEEGYWSETALRHGVSQGLYHGAILRAAVAVASLCGAADRTQALALLATVPGLRDRAESERLSIIRWLADLYPRPDGEQWGALQPDRVAEHLVAEVAEQDPEMVKSILHQVGVDQKRRAMTVLARASVRHHGVRSIIGSAIASDFASLAPIGAEVAMQIEAPDAMVNALTLAVETNAGVEDLRLLASVIPVETVALAQLGAIISARQIDLAQNEDLPQQALERLTAMANHAARLAELGRLHDGLRICDEVLDACRHRLGDDPEGYLRTLALTLVNRSKLLGDAGLPGRVESLREAIDIYRRLWVLDSQNYGPGLALATYNMAATLLEIGRPAEASPYATGAVELFAALVSSGDARYGLELASSLNAAADISLRVGHPQEAARQSQQSADLLRQLSESNADRHMRALPFVLRTVSLAQTELGDHEAALAAMQEGLDVARRLAYRDQRFLPDLAQALQGQSNCLCRLGRNEEAVDASREAVALLRALAHEDPIAFRDSLAAALNNLSVPLRRVGRSDDALAASLEAVSLGEAISTELGVEGDSSTLARALGNLASGLDRAAEPTLALEAASRSVALFRKYHSENPGGNAIQLALALLALAQVNERLMRIEDAGEASQEGYAMLKSLVDSRPGVLERNLLDAAPVRARILNALGDRRKAVEEIEYALDSFARLPDTGAEEPPVVADLHVAAAAWLIGWGAPERVIDHVLAIDPSRVRKDVAATALQVLATVARQDVEDFERAWRSGGHDEALLRRFLEALDQPEEQ